MAYPLSEAATLDLQTQLQQAVVACTERCLYHSAKWAAELLNSFPESDQDGQNLDATKKAAKGKSQVGSGQDTTGQDTLSQKSLFLALYAKYMSGEKLRDEESEMILGPQDGGVAVNKELVGINQKLEDWFRSHPDSNDSQGWLEYLYGVVLAKGKNEADAKKWFIRSIHRYSYNWGAWQELANLIESADELTSIAKQLPENLMTYIFHIYTCQELYIANDQIHQQLDQIQEYFPNNAFLKTQRALLWYHVKGTKSPVHQPHLPLLLHRANPVPTDFVRAETIFTSLLKTDPFRLDALDHYSNILFVMGRTPQLASLAQLASQTDRFRPETCVVVGNYYSLKSEHEKAVIYFRRALTLDRTFLSAWTLMGHEYTEMKNTHAAIESYRRAVDANRRDYRAWYGLGQTYELLEMYAYALWYYQRAAALRSHDPKMWHAVGSCFARVGRLPNAVRAYKRALAVGAFHEAGVAAPGGPFGSELETTAEAGWQRGAAALDPETLWQIAGLYERMGDREEAAAYVELTLAQEEGPEGVLEGEGEKRAISARFSCSSRPSRK
ncbi:MAG: hypothetical protein Q9165_007539 [Trypethelium subeluteriae]